MERKGVCDRGRGWQNELREGRERGRGRGLEKREGGREGGTKGWMEEDEGGGGRRGKRGESERGVMIVGCKEGA